MTILHPSVFSITDTELTLNAPANDDYATRLTLAGSDEYQFRGTLTGSNNPTTPTDNFEFTIDF